MRWVIFLLAVFALAATGCVQPVGDGPVVVVTASYPGASAQVVADTLAAPIEQQVNGVEGMRRLESESRSDGTYVAHVRFQPQVDAKIAVTLVENRVALAKPVLPEAVQLAHVALEPKAPEGSEKSLVTIALVDRGDHDWKELRGFSDAVLSRLAAEGALLNPETLPGPDENNFQVNLDRDKCRQREVRVANVSQTLQGALQKSKVDLTTEAKAAAATQSLKMLPVDSDNGRKIPLGDVAAIEIIKRPPAVYRVDMYPAVRITGAPPRGKTAADAAQKCVELAKAERKDEKGPHGFAVLNLTPR
jgi:multidrug efflux pump subunit AcrB